jgi:dihydrofolate synthase/folylpolyglutamate synthase
MKGYLSVVDPVKIKNYDDALSYLYSNIPRTKKKKFPGRKGLKRQKHILQLLGNPQDRVKVIHVAGTSGKGSTVSYISHLLSAHNFKVGMTVSPHLRDVRERFQIDNSLISERDFVKNLSDIIPVIEKIKSLYGDVTYFEIVIALCYYTFFQSDVDYAVVETGLGGLMDGTNIVNSKDKVAVINNIGFDHTEILGDTIEDIAEQKAGIIQNGNVCFSVEQKPEVAEIINSRVKEKGGSVEYLEEGKNFYDISPGPEGLQYSINLRDAVLENVTINSFANYQVLNSSLALKVVEYVAYRDGWKINENKIKDVLSSLEIEGRMSVKHLRMNGKDKRLILDGAHNPQKMEYFLDSLENINLTKPVNFVVSIKAKKNYRKMLELILPYADKIFITNFHVEGADFIIKNVPCEEVAEALKSMNSNDYEIVDDPVEAVNMASRISNDIVVTGSLYLLSELYQRMDL